MDRGEEDHEEVGAEGQFEQRLKGAPAPVWLQEGVPAVLKGKTLGEELETGKIASPDSGSSGSSGNSGNSGNGGAGR